MIALWVTASVSLLFGFWLGTRLAQARHVVSKDMTDYLLSVDDDRWRWGR